MSYLQHLKYRLHTKVRILSTHIQTLHKPSLFNQVRRINIRIVRSKHGLRTFKDHLRSGTLPKGYSPNINPAIGSDSNEFLNSCQNNLRKYGIGGFHMTSSKT